MTPTSCVARLSSTPSRRGLAALLALAAFAGCGRKGALYLPDDARPPPARPSTPGAVPEPAPDPNETERLPDLEDD